MKKLIFLMIFVTILMPFVSAEPEMYFKQNTETDLKISCFDINNSLCSDTTACVLNMYYPNQTELYDNVTMSKSGTNYYNYTIPAEDLSDTGIYKTLIICTDATTGFTSFEIEVTYSGIVLSTPQSIIYFMLLGVIFFVFIINLFFISKLPDSNTRDEEGKILSISYLKYLRSTLWFVSYMLFIAILYISSNVAFAYLGEQLFAQILHVLFRISFGIAPLVLTVWIVWIFVQMFHDRQFQNLLNRGFFPQGRI